MPKQEMESMEPIESTDMSSAPSESSSASSESNDPNVSSNANTINAEASQEVNKLNEKIFALESQANPDPKKMAADLKGIAKDRKQLETKLDKAKNLAPDDAKEAVAKANQAQLDALDKRIKDLHKRVESLVEGLQEQQEQQARQGQTFGGGGGGGGGQPKSTPTPKPGQGRRKNEYQRAQQVQQAQQAQQKTRPTTMRQQEKMKGLLIDNIGKEGPNQFKADLVAEKDTQGNVRVGLRCPGIENQPQAVQDAWQQSRNEAMGMSKNDPANLSGGPLLDGLDQLASDRYVFERNDPGPNESSDLSVLDQDGEKLGGKEATEALGQLTNSDAAMTLSSSGVSMDMDKMDNILGSANMPSSS